ncbi:DUF4124 domain-containing protein [Rubrivivax gelatinosus]|uniref:Uncharacterized protein DUF4124 n=1 Tax=Rubrivivax gelatinosus TaxID=28068 RepID=A0A4R2M836_RUBGE|nr:DUF4124 domain-containing protein [Rubrivivax gelatinosus]MBK1689876.1 hypothetical protein [Rubrivivax gelatinosus]TCP00384.1 uncharacterized protein DUF4124 [Rubrivivax gelatinosus]
MAGPGPLAPARWLIAALASLAGGVLAATPQPSSRSADGIYTCIDDNGRKITSDRPIPECVAREQRLLNRDGSLRRVVPPTPTADERAEIEARERRAAEARAAQADAARRDRNLMARYPNEEAHQRAREAALDTVRVAIRASEQRLKLLASDRKPMLDEAEFYPGKPLPPKLRQSLDANDAATEAQRAAMANQEAELVRINRLYDAELDRLRRLWAGARPGTLGPIPAETSSAPAR